MNIIMDDVSGAFKDLLMEGSEDYSLLDKVEKELGNFEWHTYTEEDKKMRQYEGMARVAKQVSLFTQMQGS